eukprot:TRINITY_DN7868_c0_g1_i3.p1 TRINITY_DN7868_c0_g1~~TRINITY_DN7868_c0_g1_i3.p1  ORF type:complete len:344 (+),score=43.99 TRINITY_DN7868_c0_g1_i3:124-1155(+)
MFKEIGPLAQPPQIDHEEVKAFHKAQVDQLLSYIANQQFDQIQSFWKESFRSIPAAVKEQLNREDVLKYVQFHDRETYQRIGAMLLPDVLQNTTNGYTKAVRSFSKRMGGWLTEALEGLPEGYVSIRRSEGTLFAQRLRRYTTLNHLGSAVRGLITSEEHVKAMTADYENVDFDGLKEHFVWLCEGCDAALVSSFEDEFKRVQTTATSVEVWAAWFQKIVATVLAPAKDTPQFAARCAEFQLKWAMISTMFIRDLTLRSANTFGMYHLLRLLSDEYIFFLLERAVMSGKITPLDHLPNGGEEMKLIREAESSEVRPVMSVLLHIMVFASIHEFLPHCWIRLGT